MNSVHSIEQCISKEEKSKRVGVIFINCIIWLGILVFTISTFGVILIFFLLSKLFSWIFAEYNVRTLQAYGTTVDEIQFPEISKALDEVCKKFDVREKPKIIIINQSSINAFAVRFAQKKVIVLLSLTIEGIIDSPEEIRFILGHEMAHHLLNHGPRGFFELYQSAEYKAAREMTCDNCGVASAGNLEASIRTLKRLGVGNNLHTKLNDKYLAEEAKYLYSGFTGWLLKKYMTYPPMGKRIANIKSFFSKAE